MTIELDTKLIPGDDQHVAVTSRPFTDFDDLKFGILPLDRRTDLLKEFMGRKRGAQISLDDLSYLKRRENNFDVDVKEADSIFVNRFAGRYIPPSQRM